MAQYNESIWGSSSEIVRLNYANTVSPWIPEPQDNLYRSKYSVLNTPMNADIFPNNWDIDLSFATVNIDADCPWSFVHYINRDNNFIDDGGEMSLLPWFYTGDYGGLCGWISANPGTKLRVSTTSNSNSTPAMRYYQYLGQYNTSRQVYPHWTSSSYRDQIYMPIQRSTAIVKLGGRSIVGQIRVRCKNSRTSTSIQEYTLKEYCDTRYSSYPYIVGVAIVYAWRGQTYATLDRHSVIFTALSKDINIKVGSDNITVSSWDKELNGDNANGYNNIFGNMAATAQMDTSTDYLYPIFDERSDITSGWCATNYQDFGTIQNFHDEMMKSAAYHGTFFTDTTIPYSNSIPDWLSNNMYCGVIDQNGVTHGEYTKGIRNVRNFQYDSENVSIDSNVTPKKDGSGGGSEDDPNTITGDTLSRYVNAITGFNLGTKHYAVTDQELAALNNYIYTMSDFNAVCNRWTTQGGDIRSLENLYTDDAGYKADYYTRAGYGEYPTNNYISLMAFPFDIPGSALVDSGFILGTSDTSEAYYPPTSERYDITPSTKPATKAISGNGIITLDLGSTTITHPSYTDFRAYEPYTRIELAIPYHGTIELQASEWLNHELSIEIDVDLSTGASYAYILNDGIPQYALAGSMGITVPLTATQSSDNNISLNELSIQSAAQKTALKYGAINSGIDILTTMYKAATGDAVSLTDTLKTGLKISQQIEQNTLAQKAISYKVNHTADGRSIIGTSAPSIQFASENECRLTIHYPNMLQYNADQYGRTVGYACNKQGSVSDFTGYTVCSNINLESVPCSDAEATLIIQQMQSGVIL